jgi:hypothetical protein
MIDALAVQKHLYIFDANIRDMQLEHYGVSSDEECPWYVSVMRNIAECLSEARTAPVDLMQREFREFRADTPF